MSQITVRVDPDLCVASGYCVASVREVFTTGPDGVSGVLSDGALSEGPVAVPDELVERVRQAELSCPAQAIVLSTTD